MLLELHAHTHLVLTHDSALKLSLHVEKLLTLLLHQLVHGNTCTQHRV